MEITPSDVIKTLPRQEFSLVFQKVKELEKTEAISLISDRGTLTFPLRRILWRLCGRRL